MFTTVTFTSLIAWGKSNIGMLMEISDSLLIVLKANLSLLFSTITTLFSVVLGGGHAMLKFLFNTVRIQDFGLEKFSFISSKTLS